MDQQSINTIETWLDVPGYENKYQISNLGRLKRKEYIINSYSTSTLFKKLYPKEASIKENKRKRSGFDHHRITYNSKDIENIIELSKTHKTSNIHKQFYSHLGRTTVYKIVKKYKNKQ